MIMFWLTNCQFVVGETEQRCVCYYLSRYIGAAGIRWIIIYGGVGNAWMTILNFKYFLSDCETNRYDRNRELLKIRH